MSNQASEDELKQYLHEMHHRIMGDYDGDPDEEHPYQDETKPYFWEDEAKRLQQLIRTEKLKLLAEMRELIVDKPTGNYNADSLLERDVLIYNQATAYLRTKLAEWLKESV